MVVYLAAYDIFDVSDVFVVSSDGSSYRSWFCLFTRISYFVVVVVKFSTVTFYAVQTEFTEATSVR